MRNAFTLVELLAVIAILVLLITLLLPTLSGARDLAERAKCMDNYRQIGVAFQGFAASHMERGPGKAYNFRPGVTNRGNWFISDGNICTGGEDWMSMVENEYFHTDTSGSHYVTRLSRYFPVRNTPAAGGWDPYHPDMQMRKQQLVCPTVRVSTFNGQCEMCVCADFVGGERRGFNGLDDANDPLEGPYGLRVTPPPAMSSTNSTPWSFYSLGPRYVNFPDPARQWSIWESCGGNSPTDQVLDYNADNSAGPYLNDIRFNGVSWIGHNGQYAFRHYNRTGVVLKYDGHVDTFTTTDPIQAKALYLYKLP
jgi:prepilin-type N-terminal cleavage/methylation domain-containing protein